MKITSRLVQDADGDVRFSFEVFLPDNDAGIKRLRQRMEALTKLGEPAFFDLSGRGDEDYVTHALPLCVYASRVLGVPCLLHLVCTELDGPAFQRCVEAAKAASVKNLFVERGRGDNSSFVSVADAVAWIKGTYADYFCVAVAGFPCGLGDDGGQLTDEPARLKAKQDAGADFIIAQHTYDAGAFTQWRGQALAAGVCIPAVPSVLTYHNREALVQINAACGVPLPATLASMAMAGGGMPLGSGAGAAPTSSASSSATSALASGGIAGCSSDGGVASAVVPLGSSIGGSSGSLAGSGGGSSSASSIGGPAVAAAASRAADDLLLREQAQGTLLSLCHGLYAAGLPVVHFLTLNLETPVRSLLSELALIGPGARSRRRLPWRPSADEARAGEDVRPIFWALRPASYVERTASWGSFPSGRWRSSSSDLQHRPFESAPQEVLAPAELSAEARRAMWGEVYTSHRDVWDVFAGYVEGKVPRLPWCEVALHPETTPMSAALSRLNRAGFLSINSQPRVNGLPSDDPVHGWGGVGGYVYQKAYVECFMDPSHLAALMEAAARRPTISFQAVDVHGNTYSNCKSRTAQAVTWGVFPAREILQPTVVDPDAFLEWKSEAFALWRSHWAAIYDEDAPAADVLHEMIETYFLVNVVDHDYIGGDIFAVFEEALSILQARAAAGAGGGPGSRLAAEATAAAAGASGRPLPSVSSAGGSGSGSGFATPAWALLPSGSGSGFGPPGAGTGSLSLSGVSSFAAAAGLAGAGVGGFSAGVGGAFGGAAGVAGRYGYGGTAGAGARGAGVGSAVAGRRW